MLSALTGVGMLAGALAVVYPFIPAAGTEPNRNEWVDITVAITASALLAGGISLILIGIVSFAR